MAFVFFSLLLTAVEAFVIKVGCAFAFGGVFREDFVASLEGTLWGCGAALILALVGLFFALNRLKRRAKK